MRKYLLILLTCSGLITHAQSWSEAELAKIRDINNNIANIVVKSAIGFKDLEGAVRQNDNGTIIYDAKEIPGMHAQQYFVTEVPAKFRSIYMSYYTNPDDVAYVIAAVFAEPAFAGSKWTLRINPSKSEGETDKDILLAGVKVGNLNVRSKEKTAVLSLGFYEDPGSVSTPTAAPVKEEPKVTAKCESGNCQAGKGELVIFSKTGILTDRLSGEFGGGQFTKGIHYMYGTGLGPASYEKDEGIFKEFILTQGTVTLSGYGLKDSVFDTKNYTDAGNCISGDCNNGEGRFLQMTPSFGRAQIFIFDGKFKDHGFLEGTVFIEGVDTLFDGNYTIKNYHYRPKHNQAFADAVFIPRGYSEEIKGTWFAQSNGFQRVPFYLSDDYHRHEGRFIMELKTKNLPAWLMEVYIPISNARAVIHDREAHEQAVADLEYDMKIHPNDYKTDNNVSTNTTCSCCNGTGSVGSGKTFMGREIPKRCSCCGGTGRRY